MNTATKEQLIANIHFFVSRLDERGLRFTLGFVRGLFLGTNQRNGG